MEDKIIIINSLLGTAFGDVIGSVFEWNIVEKIKEN